jgi:hypothetical protein
MNKVINIATSLFQFLPLTVFSFYSFRTGVPSQERLFNGFMIGAVLAVMQLIWLMRQQRPANRLILGANLWLIIGGVAVFLKLWNVLNIYRELREAGVLAGMLAIGIVTALFSRAGYVGSMSGETVLVRRYSYLLLFATAFAMLCGLYFRGNTFLSAVIPILVLVMLHRFLNARLGIVCRGDNV